MTGNDDILSIGALAAKAGISVRALRHYEAVGLLAPGRNPDNNRRRYGAADIERVMKIITLKTAGLELRTIGKALEGGIDLPVLIKMQIRQLQDQHEKTRSALVVLQKAAERLDRDEPLSVDLLCHIMRSTTMTKYPDESVFKDYFDPEQLQQIKHRGTSPAALADYGRQWGELIARVQKLVDEEAPADGGEALQCAREWNDLIGAFTQNDPGITQSLAKMYADKDAWKDRAQMPYSPQAGDFIARAGRALKERGQA